jgi:hypothetical protein
MVRGVYGIKGAILKTLHPLISPARIEPADGLHVCSVRPSVLTFRARTSGFHRHEIRFEAPLCETGATLGFPRLHSKWRISGPE